MTDQSKVEARSKKMFSESTIPVVRPVTRPVVRPVTRLVVTSFKTAVGLILIIVENYYKIKNTRHV